MKKILSVFVLLAAQLALAQVDNNYPPSNVWSYENNEPSDVVGYNEWLKTHSDFESFSHLSSQDQAIKKLSDVELSQKVVGSFAKMVVSCGMTSNLLALSVAVDTIPILGQISYFTADFLDCPNTKDSAANRYVSGIGGVLSIPIRSLYQWLGNESSLKNSFKYNYEATQCVLSSMNTKEATSNVSCGTKVREYLAYSDELALRNPKAFEVPARKGKSSATSSSSRVSSAGAK